MDADTRYIDKIAGITRKALGLRAPIELSSLCKVIEEKLAGKCEEVESFKLNVDALIKTADECNSNALFTIKYRNDMPKTRVLFSVAHELGHLFMHLLEEDGTLKQSAIMERNLMTSESELEANEYAAAFLMPEDDFIIQCDNYKNEEDKVNVTSVAKFFNVSVQAATIRGNVLGLWK